MTDEKQLTVRPTMPDVMTLGATLAKSGYFQDARDAAQAVVKVLAGQELGLGPVASMTGIYIVKGRVTLSANVMAAVVKRSGRYNYKVTRLDDTGCSITFYEGKSELGASTFTADDAKRAELGGDNYRKFPRNMYFSRALSNGVKWYCPDVTSGPVYTPDELGEVVDGETGEIIGPKRIEPVVKVEEPVQAPPQLAERPPVVEKHIPRPWSAELVRGAARKRSDVWARGRAGDWSDAEPVGHDGKRTKASEKQINAVAGIMAAAVTRQGMIQLDIDTARHAVLGYVFDVASTNDLCAQECSAILDLWKQEGVWETNEYAAPEAAAIITAWQKAAGQAELALPA